VRDFKKPGAFNHSRSQNLKNQSRTGKLEKGSGQKEVGGGVVGGVLMVWRLSGKRGRRSRLVAG